MPSSRQPRAPRTLPANATPSKRHSPPDPKAANEEDLDPPTSAVRPILSLSAVPWLAIDLDGLRCLPLDARSAYLLSLVDGHCSVDVILDICERDLARDEALGIFARLLELGAIELYNP